MTNGRQARTKRDTSREPGRFITLPVSVLESAAYFWLSSNARSLLLEVALQCHGNDNGRMLLSRVHLKKRGWKGAGGFDKAKRELLDAELIFETVKGHRPNHASWFAVTWRRLDKHPGFDHGIERAFELGAYRRVTLAAKASKPKKGALLSPLGGTERPSIAPLGGTEKPSPVPLGGAIRALPGAPPVPLGGHPLDRPSTGGGSQPVASLSFMGRLLWRRLIILPTALRPNGCHEARRPVPAGPRAKRP